MPDSLRGAWIAGQARSDSYDSYLARNDNYLACNDSYWVVGRVRKDCSP